MKHKFFILISFLLLSGVALNAQKNDVAIRKEYQRIENSKALMIDSLTHIRGIDFNLGSNADEKKYKIFKEKKKIVKIEYQEIKNGYRKWDKKTTVYFKSDTPFFIVERTNGVMTLYLIDGGEESKPYKEIEEIYIYDWHNEKIKRIYNGHEANPQMKICKACYEELIEKVKLEFNAKQ